MPRCVLIIVKICPEAALTYHCALPCCDVVQAMSLYQDLNTGFLEVSCLFAAQKGPKPVLAFNLFRDTKGLEAIKGRCAEDQPPLGR